MTRQSKITSVRCALGLQGLLIYCADYRCSHSILRTGSSARRSASCLSCCRCASVDCNACRTARCRKSPFDVVAQDGSFFRKPQFDVIALGIREMRLKQSAITSDVVAMRVHEGGFSVHDVTSSCRAYSIVFSSRKCCGKRFTDTFAQYRTSSVIGPWIGADRD